MPADAVRAFQHQGTAGVLALRWGGEFFGQPVILGHSSAGEPVTRGTPHLRAFVRSCLTGAAATIAALPILFVYVVAGKYCIRGLTAGSGKGEGCFFLQ